MNGHFNWNNILSLDRPLPPRNLTVSNIKAESCYLQWDPPTDNGGSELTNYIVEKKEIGAEEPAEGQEAKPEWEMVNNSVVEKKLGVRPYNNSGGSFPKTRSGR